MTGAQRRAAALSQKKKIARKHWHVCEHCPSDRPRLCFLYPCRNMKKKLCGDCQRAKKYHRPPEPNLFTAHPYTVDDLVKDVQAAEMQAGLSVVKTMAEIVNKLAKDALVETTA